ncbi:MAG: hypothetical protein NTW95_08630 [Candidatus Aminicenantes bacterium]|nr:hypothetical protein [Candidatus Aminicenantes bacterium]
MRPGKLAAALFRLLIGLAMILAFVVLDWYPLVRELGGLRREQKDLKRKTTEYNALSARFAFPDAREQALLAGSDSNLLRALPQIERDEAWETMVQSALLEGAAREGIPDVRVWVTSQASAAEPKTGGQPLSAPLFDWIFRRQAAPLADGFALAANPGRFRWYGIFSGLESGRGRLASRPLAVAVMAPLAKLLNFIQRTFRGAGRLEIVRLRLEPSLPFSRAWLTCRGSYLSNGPSRWLLPQGAGSDDGLLVDPDSPLLGQRVVSGR